MRSTGVAFEVELTRSRQGARLAAVSAAVPALGLVLAGWQWLAGPTLLGVEDPALRTAMSMLAALAGAALAWGAVRALRDARRGSAADPRPRASAGRLVVDARGLPTLLHRAVGPCEMPCAIRSTCALPGLILIVLTPDPTYSPEARQPPITLRLGRDTMNDESWRRLNVWLRWMERGRHDVPATRPE